MTETTHRSFIFTLSCKTRPGIVADVTGLLFEQGGNVLELQQFDDIETNRFFMRIVFEFSDGDDQPDRVSAALDALGDPAPGEWRIRPKHQRKKVLILVSKFDHCLADLLYRNQIGELAMDIVGIVSNHPISALAMPGVGAIPYHHFPITKETKTEQESRVRSVMEENGAELVVLARYMQVLSEDFSRHLSGRCVNIHHSFLPGFKGAKPYHQAHARGVKMIGATAHFVTPDLDEGPIIVQDVETITHADTPGDLIRKGRGIEQRVLSRAVTFLLEDRVFLNGSKTVVFEG